ncbi:MAG TPA: YihY/virulence factor BrkB family protein [Gemmatimonadaceae bacterium]|nr:YihY/virulence factor BrkB family protein [Gemmatimonadaceae bacterium]
MLRQTFSKWNADDAPRLGAAIAYYSILSMAPLVVLVLAIVALIFGRAAAKNQLLAQVGAMMGAQGAETVKALIEHAQEPASGALASVLGILTLLLGASAVFGELRSALNKIWDVTPAADDGLWATVKQRFFSFGMVLAVGFLLLVSLLLSSVLTALSNFFGGFLSIPRFLLSIFDLVISLAGIAVSFALIFRYVPNRRIPWKDLWVGAIFTALLFTIGKFLIGLYIGNAAVGSAYGAAGSLVIVIVWVYYSALIFLFGAEFTHVLSSGRHTRSSHATQV